MTRQWWQSSSVFVDRCNAMYEEGLRRLVESLFQALAARVGRRHMHLHTRVGHRIIARKHFVLISSGKVDRRLICSSASPSSLPPIFVRPEKASFSGRHHSRPPPGRLCDRGRIRVGGCMLVRVSAKDATASGADGQREGYLQLRSVLMLHTQEAKEDTHCAGQTEPEAIADVTSQSSV